MTPEEKEFIIKNLHQLITNTSLKSGTLVAILQQNVLTEEEKQIIERAMLNTGEYQGGSELYRIIQIKQNGLSILLNALEETKQTQASAILKRFFFDKKTLSNTNPQKRIDGQQISQAEQLISFVRPPDTADKNTRTTIVINTPLLDRMVEVCGSRPICIYCVCGPARQGKSFLLGYMIRRLTAMENGTADSDWMCRTGIRRKWPLSKTGTFEFRNQTDHVTEGVMLWNHPFIVENDSQEYAILLVDTQGTFDSSTSTRDMTAIVSLSLLTCSVMVFNFFTNLQEDTLSSFNTYVQYGKLALEQSENLPPFQKLVFLIRDWNNKDEFAYGSEGGMAFLEKKLEIKATCSKEATEVRASIQKCFDELNCYLMPPIGPQATTNKFTGSVSELDPIFEAKLEDFVENLILANDFIPKKILGKPVTAGELQLYLNQYVNTFNSDDIPQPLSVWEVTIQIFFTNLVEKCVKNYDKIVKNAEDGESYLTIKKVNGAHEQGLKTSQDLFEDSKKIGDDVQRQRFNSDLATKLEQIGQRFQNDHKQRRDIYVQTTTKSTLDTFKSKLNLKFPLNKDEFEEDIHITEVLDQIKATVMASYQQKFPSEDAAQKQELTQLLERDIDEAITQCHNKNNLQRLNAEKKIEKIITERVTQYQTELLHLFSTNVFVSFELFQSQHKTSTNNATMEMKISKNPKLVKLFEKKLNMKLTQEFANFENKHKLYLMELHSNADQQINREVAEQEAMIRCVPVFDVIQRRQIIQALNTQAVKNFSKAWNAYPKQT